MPDLFMHPSVISFITDESQLFPYAQGLTILFAPVFSEKGADNVLGTVDSAGEYIDKYGEPNSVLYGQAPLQTVEWVKAGGQAVVMRLLPEDACFAHAVLDFQTKSNPETIVQSWEYVFTTSGGDELRIPIIRTEDTTRPGTFIYVAAANPAQGFAGKTYRTNLRTGITAEQALTADLGPVSGGDPYVETISQPIILLRPQIKRAPAGVGTRDALVAWARSLHNADATNDGYEHNVYGFFLPKGRGSRFYNDLEFKISGTDQYDDTYEFRVYTIEVYQRALGGQLKHLDGPFTVSFDPNALARDNQSMFIGDVLATYADELDFELLASSDITDPTDDTEPNWLGFESLGEALTGGTVDPALLDPFFLAERDLAAGETSYHKFHVLLGGATSVLLSAAAGDAAIYVADPSVLYPGCSISIGGRPPILVGELTVNVDIVTGKITLVEVLDEDIDAGEAVSISGEVESTAGIALTLDQTEYALSYESDELVFNPESETTAGTPAVLNDGGTVLWTKSGEPKFSMERIGVNSGAATIQIFDVSDDFVSEEQVILEEMSEIEDEIQKIKFRTVSGLTYVQLNAVGGGTTSYMKLVQYSTYEIDGTFSMDYDANVKLKKGTNGRIDPALALVNPLTSVLYNSITEKNNLLIRAYTGITNDEVMLKRWWPFDVILDANYTAEVKTAMNQMAAVMRGDLVFVADLGFTANPEQAISKRDTLAQFSDFYTAIYAQDYVIYDVYAGKRVRVTSPYFCAQKMPFVDRNYGIHWPFVGPRRGIISGFKDLSWNPNDAWQERLYKRQINYTKRDPKRTMLFGQLTSQTVISALSDLSHVRALLRIQRDVEIMMEDYQFEFINSATLNAANSALNAYLKIWIENGCCTSIKGSVYSSAYDQKQKLARVRIELYFTAILERIVINLVVKG